MNSRDFSVGGYVQLLNARAGKCEAIDRGHRYVASLEHGSTGSRSMGRGTPNKGLLDDEPFELVHGGKIEFYACVSPAAGNGLVIEHYRIVMMDLPDNANGISSLRYDWDLRPDSRQNCDAELGDEPGHPQGHIHVNFLYPGDNDCRMPTGCVCPILLLCSLNYWYCLQCEP